MVYRLNETYNLKTGPSPLIVLPLGVVTLFCFGFILIASPKPAKTIGQAASSQSNPESKNVTPALPELSFASPSTLTQLSEPSSSTATPATSETPAATSTPATQPTSVVQLPAVPTLSKSSSSSDKKNPASSQQKDNKKQKYWWQR